MHFDLLYMQILCFGLVLLAAFFGGKISRHLHVGEVVGQVVGGLVVGPVFLLFLENRIPVYKEAIYSLHFLAFIFLSIVAFGIGDELSMDKIKRVGRGALVICIIQASATFLLVTATFLLLGFEPINAFIIGSIGIATAPASTFVIMNKLGITGKMRSMLGGIVVLDDVIEVIIFSIVVQVAIIFQVNGEISWGGIFLPVIEDFGFAILLGLGIFIILRLVVERRWLRPKEDKSLNGHVLGPEFLSRLITEMPGPSMETFVIIWGTVSLGVGFALHWHLPFLITAVTAGVLISNLYSRQLFESLRIENASSMYTLIFFALIGANADIEAFRPENLIYVGAYIVARSVGKVGGTWISCKMTKQEKKLIHVLPKLMLPQAGVAAIEAFFVATVLGKGGEVVLGIILPGIVFFEIVGVLLSERALIKWRSWMTGGGELIGEEEIIREKLENEKIDINNLIRPECLIVPLNVKSKGEAIWVLIRTLQSVGYIDNPGEVLEIILERERQGGTTIGEGVAILHGRIPELTEPSIVLGLLPKDHGINFGTTDDIPISIIYMVLSPADKPELHLQILAAIARFLSDSEVRTRLRYAKNELEAMDIIREHAEVTL
jgi:mannitol/fructose-specific phosphotransferase system IIA component (Ntr-type)/Kef-type K+ transport system membrane component KefB